MARSRSTMPGPSLNALQPALEYGELLRMGDPGNRQDGDV